MPALNFVTVIIVIVVILAVAALGGVLTGDALKTWFPQLAKPRIQLPLWGFYVVGGIVYLMDAIILYRLIEFVSPKDARIVILTALLVVMLYNELWNYAFFGLRSTLAGFIGLLGFLAPLIILHVTLFVYDPPSAFVLLPYSIYVVVYDIPWTYALWKLNTLQS